MSTEKKARKFNIIDVIIILAVVAAIAIVGYKFAGKKIVQSTNTQEFEVTYTVYEVANTTAEIIKEGDVLTDNAGNVPLGNVTKVEVEKNSRSYAPNSDGEYVMSAKEGFCFVAVTGKVNAVKANNGITVNGTEYLVGHSITLEAGDAKLYALITAITPITSEK